MEYFVRKSELTYKVNKKVTLIKLTLLKKCELT